MTMPSQPGFDVLCELALRMGDAEKERNTTFFDSLLSEKLTFRRANGDVSDKATFRNDLIDPSNTYELLDSEVVSAVVHEGVALVTLLVRAKGTKNGKPFAGLYRNLRTFMPAAPGEDPSWRLHAWFNVRVSDLLT